MYKFLESDKMVNEGGGRECFVEEMTKNLELDSLSHARGAQALQMSNFVALYNGSNGSYEVHQM